MVALTDLGADAKEGSMTKLWAELPGLWVSVDPGDRHVGWSEWTGPVCFESYEIDPDTAVDLTVQYAGHGHLGLLVYEAFNLRGPLAMQQQGSEFLTSQLIGALRHVCRRAGVPTVSYRPSDYKGLFKQPEFKPPLRAQREWRSYGRGGHSKDSECLGEGHVRRTLLRGKGY